MLENENDNRLCGEGKIGKTEQIMRMAEQDRRELYGGNENENGIGLCGGMRMRMGLGCVGE
jgi:hypothetical protein